MSRRELALVILLAVVMVFTMLTAFAQQVDSSQMKLKTNGGLTAGADNALAVIAYRDTSAPSSPVAGQLWCDTTTTPCTLYQYTGSTWSAPQVNAAVTVVERWVDLPGSPTDGMMVYVRSIPALAFYDSTAAKWLIAKENISERNNMYYTSAAQDVAAQHATLPNVFDVYTAAVIATPGAATAATSGTAGSLSAGTYSYKITCRNSTGGETDGGTVSNTITSLVSKSADLSSIPICGSGGVQRNVYRTKVNAAATGPWYFVGNIADNTTTTYHDGLADASAVTLAPDVNFSAPLPTGWTVVNYGTQTTGGCGGTGASRATMACYAGVNWFKDNGGTVPNDGGVHAFRDLTPYLIATPGQGTASGNGAFTLTYRVTNISQNGDTYPNVCNPTFGGLRSGMTANAFRIQYHAGSYTCTFQTPPSGSNHPRFGQNNRQGWGANVTADAVTTNPFPQIDAFPWYVKYIRVGSTNGSQFQVSADGVNFTPDGAYTGGNNYNYVMTPLNLGYLWPTNLFDTFDIAVGTTDTNATYQSGPWIEIDSFAIIVR